MDKTPVVGRPRRGCVGVAAAQSLANTTRRDDECRCVRPSVGVWHDGGVASRRTWLSVAIDDAFARWDRAHLDEFHLFEPGATFEARPTRVADPDPDWDDEAVLPLRSTKLSMLKLGQEFLYVFDLGDDWTHLCVVAERLIDPAEQVGLGPDAMPGPLPYWGWGSIPDQYGRRWHGDGGDGEPAPPDPECRDLPPLRLWWGPRSDVRAEPHGSSPAVEPGAGGLPGRA